MLYHRKTSCQLYQNQIARTAAAFLGIDFSGDPEGGRPAGEIIQTMFE